MILKQLKRWFAIFKQAYQLSKFHFINSRRPCPPNFISHLFHPGLFSFWQLLFYTRGVVIEIVYTVMICKCVHVFIRRHGWMLCRHYTIFMCTATTDAFWILCQFINKLTPCLLPASRHSCTCIKFALNLTYMTQFFDCLIWSWISKLGKFLLKL